MYVTFEDNKKKTEDNLLKYVIHLTYLTTNIFSDSEITLIQFWLQLLKKYNN